MQSDYMELIAGERIRSVLDAINLHARTRRQPLIHRYRRRYSLARCCGLGEAPSDMLSMTNNINRPRLFDLLCALTCCSADESRIAHHHQHSSPDPSGILNYMKVTVNRSGARGASHDNEEPVRMILALYQYTSPTSVVHSTY
jgi:hypothetical protein